MLLPMDDEKERGRDTKESSAVHSQERILRKNLGNAEKLGLSMSSLSFRCCYLSPRAGCLRLCYYHLLAELVFQLAPCTLSW